jgi:hypothetical protein
MAMRRKRLHKTRPKAKALQGGGDSKVGDGARLSGDRPRL